MKKLLGLFLLIVFAFSFYFTISNDVVTKSNDSSGYASIIPIPPPERPQRGA